MREQRKRMTKERNDNDRREDGRDDDGIAKKWKQREGKKRKEGNRRKRMEEAERVSMGSQRKKATSSSCIGKIHRIIVSVNIPLFSHKTLYFLGGIQQNPY